MYHELSLIGYILKFVEDQKESQKMVIVLIYLNILTIWGQNLGHNRWLGIYWYTSKYDIAQNNYTISAYMHFNKLN